MKGWKTVFSVRNKGLFVHKSGDFRLKNRADPDKILREIKYKIRRNTGLKFNF